MICLCAAASRADINFNYFFKQRKRLQMIRRIMILMLIILVGYIFYEEFMADSLEPFVKKVGEKKIFYQVRIPKIAIEDNLSP